MPHGPFPAPEHTSYFVLYDPKDGRIFHVHRTVVYSGGMTPSHAEIEKNARHGFAHGQSLKRHGEKIDGAHLKGLYVAEELRPDRKYRVDVHSGHVVEVSH